MSNYNPTIEERVEILYSDPYRYYIVTNLWVFRGASRIQELETLLKEAEHLQKFELCIRIKEVIQYLSNKYSQIDGEAT